MEIPVTVMVTGIFLIPNEDFSLVFSLIGVKTQDGKWRLAARDAFDERLHSGSALLLHFVRNMAVNVQRKCGCCVSQRFLYGLNIVTALDCRHRVRVPLRYNFDKPEKLDILMD